MNVQARGSVVNICVLILTLVSVIACNSSSTSDTPNSSESLRKETLAEKAAERITVIHAGPMFAVQQLRLDEPPLGSVVLSDDQVPMALGKAAQLYALSSGDYAVTLEDVKTAGFWPYDIPASGQDEAVFPALGNSSEVNIRSYIKLLGQDEYKLEARYDILLSFDFEYYEQNSDKYVTLDPGQLKTFERREFWANPLTGAPMQESQSVGDYSLITRKAASCNLGGYGGAESITLPVINVARAVADSRAASDVPETCCLFTRVSTSGGRAIGTHTFTECFNACDDGAECCVNWTVTGVWVERKYHFVRKVPCDYQAGDNEVVRQDGQRAPTSMWGGSGSVTGVNDTCLACVQGQTGAGYNDYVNLLTQLGSPGDWWAATAPGPKCDI